MKKLIVIVLFLFACQISLAEVAVTIYNNDLGLVRETRELDFPKGMGEIRFTDVAERIIPTSVHFFSDKAELLEQNYEYDLVDARKVLAKYVDQRIQLFTEGEGSFIGTLLAASGDIVLKEDDNSVRVISAEKIYNYHFPTLPEGLITKPTLVWKVNSAKGGKGEGEVSYLTNGISWTSEYIAVTDTEDKSLSFTGWVNIDNRCGTAFKDAKLKLIAGDVQIQRDRGYNAGMIETTVAFSVDEESRSFSEESFYDYHLYTLQRKSTILDNQIKQISLFPTAAVKVVNKEYRVDWSSDKGKVSVSLLFENTEKNNLGIPLPKGKVRVYKESKSGDLEFVGEDQIGHSPRNEPVRIKTGSAFDFACERNRLDRKRDGNDWEEEWEIKIRNRKEEAVEVIVPARLNGDWTILEATPGWEKVSSTLVEWKVKIDPDEEVILKYRVLVRR